MKCGINILHIYVIQRAQRTRSRTNKGRDDPEQAQQQEKNTKKKPKRQPKK